MSTKTILHLEVATHECNDNETYQHDLPEGTDPVKITEAVYTIYGHEGVLGFSINAMEVEDKEEE